MTLNKTFCRIILTQAEVAQAEPFSFFKKERKTFTKKKEKRGDTRIIKHLRAADKLHPTLVVG